MQQMKAERQRQTQVETGDPRYDAWRKKHGLTEMPEWQNFLLQTGMGIAPAMLLNAMGVEGMAPWMIAMTAPQFATPYVKKMMGYDPEKLQMASSWYRRGMTPKQGAKEQATMAKKREKAESPAKGSKKTKAKAKVADTGAAQGEGTPLSKASAYDVLLDRLHQVVG
jgi:hypothetical protein